MLIDTPPHRLLAYTRGGRAHTADTHRVHVTARVRPDHGCTVDGSTRHRGSAAQSPRDRSADPRPSARQHPVRNRMIRDGYGTRGTSTLTDHGEPSPRGRGATRGATWCMACAVVSTCMHVEPRGATWSMKCAVVSTYMQVEHGHAVHERTPNAERRTLTSHFKWYTSQVM